MCAYAGDVRQSPARQGVRWGPGEYELTLPPAVEGVRIEPPLVPAASAEADIVRRALARPLGAPPLRELARGKRSAAILVPGKDRVAGASLFLPPLLEALNAAGIPDERIQVFLATGTHIKHTAEQAREVLGAEAAARVRWQQHECSNQVKLKSVGTTSRGNEVRFNKAVLTADLKILTGRVIPHYFAGFGGGRKALLPGVAGLATILRNHRLMLNPRRGIHPRARPCSLGGNPVHLDMVEAGRMVEGTFVLNTILDVEHKLVHAFAGDLEAAHEAACAVAARIFRVRVPERFDAVITSSGGDPYDCNFVQALKALFDVQGIVRPGAAVLCLARCPEGLKEDFLRWAQVEKDADLERAVRADYGLAGHNSIMLRRLLRRARLALWSDLPADHVRRLGIEPVSCLPDGVDWLRSAAPRCRRWAIVPSANVTHVTCRRGAA